MPECAHMKEWQMITKGCSAFVYAHHSQLHPYLSIICITQKHAHSVLNTNMREHSLIKFNIKLLRMWTLKLQNLEEVKVLNTIRD